MITDLCKCGAYNDLNILIWQTIFMFQFLDTATEAETQECQAILVKDMDVMPCVPSKIVPHSVPPSEHLYGMPTVDRDCACNCTQDMAQSQPMVVLRRESTSAPTQRQSPDDDSEDVHKLTMLVRGSTYNVDYQTALRKARHTMSKSPHRLPVTFEKEPDNVKDVNAIKVCVPSIEVPNQIGYIGGSRLESMHDALNNSSLQEAVISKLTRHYHVECGTYYKAEISVLKECKWLKENIHYSYNSLFL